MTLEEFETYVEGKTLYYARTGQAYGAEQYLPGRHVIWSFLDNDCQRGYYYADQGAICFVYEVERSPQCWEFRRDGGGISATYLDPDGGSELVEINNSPEPLFCPGPEVGV